MHGLYCNTHYSSRTSVEHIVVYIVCIMLLCILRHNNCYYRNADDDILSNPNEQDRHVLQKDIDSQLLHTALYVNDALERTLQQKTDQWAEANRNVQNYQRRLQTSEMNLATARGINVQLELQLDHAQKTIRQLQQQAREWRCRNEVTIAQLNMDKRNLQNDLKVRTVCMNRFAIDRIFSILETLSKQFVRVLA